MPAPVLDCLTYLWQRDAVAPEGISAMLIAIPDLLSPDEVADVRATIDAADWIDGNATSGPQSALAKRNEQLPEDGDAA